MSFFITLPLGSRRFACGDDATNFFASFGVQVGPGVNYHHDLIAHHADGSPSLLVWIRVFPRCDQGALGLAG